jgi:hypothetical protein
MLMELAEMFDGDVFVVTVIHVHHSFVVKVFLIRNAPTDTHI